MASTEEVGGGEEVKDKILILYIHLSKLYTDLNDSAKQRLLIDIERNSGKLDGKKKEIDINDGKREEEEEDESGDEKEEVEARKVVEEQKRGGPSIQKKGSSSGGGRTSNAAPTRASSRRSQSVVEDDEGSASVRYDRKGKQRA